jgi:hypothetical protein
MRQPPDNGRGRPAQAASVIPVDASITRADPVPLRQAVAELLDRSDERDRFLDRILQAWREGYLRGHQAGYEAGYAQAVTDWKVTAGLLSGGPSFAELDRRRYPPGGRLSWIQPRDGGQGRKGAA